MFIFPLLRCCFGISIPSEIQLDSNSPFHQQRKFSVLPEILQLLWIFFFFTSYMATVLFYIYLGNLIISPTHPTQTHCSSEHKPSYHQIQSLQVRHYTRSFIEYFFSIMGRGTFGRPQTKVGSLKCDDVHYIADSKNITYSSGNSDLTSQHLCNVQAP